MFRFIMDSPLPGRVLALAFILFFVLPALRAQFAPPPPTTQVRDASALSLPPGPKLQLSSLKTFSARIAPRPIRC